MTWSNESCQPTPGERATVFWSPVARHGCTLRYRVQQVRIICQLIVLVSLLSGCVTHKSPDAFSELPLSLPKAPQQVQRAGGDSQDLRDAEAWMFDEHFLDDYWREVERMGALQQQADVVFEAESVDHFLLLKPVSPAVQTVRGGLDGYLHFIPKRTQSGGGFVVLIVDAFQLPSPTKKIMDEVILDVRDAAFSRGYNRFVVGVRIHGVVTQIYAQGLPSRDQVAQKKSDLEKLYEHFGKDRAK
jgi:hypothetical protein